MVTQARGTTATISSAGVEVPFTWGYGTVIVDAVDAKARDVRIGTCVLVLPPSNGAEPTAKALDAAVVRVVGASPSCPPVPGAKPTSPKEAQNGMGSVTLVGGHGVIGTVSAISHRRLTLKSAGKGKVRTISVSTSSATQYRKAGDHPRTAVETGRCAVVWGTAHRGSRLVATRIRVSDPVNGTCGDASLN